MNHFTPNYLTADMAQRWPSLRQRIAAAYEAAGHPIPADPNEYTPGPLIGAQSAADVLDDLKAAYLAGTNLDAAALADYQHRWEAAQFLASAAATIASAQHYRAQTHGRGVLDDALRDLAPRFALDAKALARAAQELHPELPTDATEAIRYGSSQQLAKAQQVLYRLGAIASLHTKGRDAHAADRQALMALAPVLDVPETGYAEPRSVADVANGVGVQPLAGTRTVYALANAAADSLDHALVRVARGDFPDVTISLAGDQSVTAKRVERINRAFDSRPYTLEDARATQRGYVGYASNAPTWPRYVIAHHTSTNPAYVPIGRTEIPVGA